MGLEHLFAGLAQGVGETKLSMEKEKRDRKDKEQQVQLQTITNLLAMPGLKPEQKSDLFKVALQVASGNDKKIVDGMHGILGPLLAGQQDSGDGQTGGVRPSQQATPQAAPQQGDSRGKAPQPVAEGGGQAPLSSDLPKMGSSGQQSMFYSPEEETQQMASRAGAIAGAQAQATSPIDVKAYKEKLAAEWDVEKQKGNMLVGFTAPDPVTGKVTPIYMNHNTGQSKYGGEVDPFTSLEAMRAIETMKAQAATAREEGVKNILLGWGKDPAKATPQEKQRAEQAYGRAIVDEQQTETDVKKSGIFHNVVTGLAAGDKSLEKGALNAQQEAMEENRQRDDYDKNGQRIGAIIKQVNDAKEQASQAFANAMTIKQYLEQQRIDQDAIPSQDEAKQGLTWSTYTSMINKGNEFIRNAANVAQSATQQFKGQVNATGVGGKPGEWPDLQDIREPFSYKQRPFTPMPTQGGKGRSQQIDVPKSLMDKYFRGPQP